MVASDDEWASHLDTRATSSSRSVALEVDPSLLGDLLVSVHHEVWHEFLFCRLKSLVIFCCSLVGRFSITGLRILSREILLQSLGSNTIADLIDLKCTHP